MAAELISMSRKEIARLEVMRRVPGEIRRAFDSSPPNITVWAWDSLGE